MRMHDEARAELVAVRDLNRRIDALLAEQSKLRQRLFSLGGGQSEPVSGTKESDLSGGVAKLVDMSREIDDMIDEYVDERRRVKTRIDALTDERYRLILHYHYIVGLPLFHVAERLHYGYGWTRDLHGEALAAYDAAFFAPKTQQQTQTDN